MACEEFIYRASGNPIPAVSGDEGARRTSAAGQGSVCSEEKKTAAKKAEEAAKGETLMPCQNATQQPDGWAAREKSRGRGRQQQQLRHGRSQKKRDVYSILCQCLSGKPIDARSRWWPHVSWPGIHSLDFCRGKKGKNISRPTCSIAPSHSDALFENSVCDGRWFDLI